jgi:hypothetical protein
MQQSLQRYRSIPCLTWLVRRCVQRTSGGLSEFEARSCGAVLTACSVLCRTTMWQSTSPTCMRPHRMPTWCGRTRRGCRLTATCRFQTMPSLLLVPCCSPLLLGSSMSPSTRNISSHRCTIATIMQALQCNCSRSTVQLKMGLHALLDPQRLPTTSPAFMRPGGHTRGASVCLLACLRWCRVELLLELCLLLFLRALRRCTCCVSRRRAFSNVHMTSLRSVMCSSSGRHV